MIEHRHIVTPTFVTQQIETRNVWRAHFFTDYPGIHNKYSVHLLSFKIWIQFLTQQRIYSLLHLHNHWRTKELPNNCLLGQKQALEAMLLLDLAESFPRRNINPGLPPALSQPRSCCHAARCIKTQFSWKQNAPWSLGEALGMVRILMPGELKCLPFEMSSCQSKYL